MKRIARILVCFMLMVGLAYSPVVLPQLENTPVVATAEAATKVKINKKTATVRRGATVKLKITGTKKTVKWSSSDKSIATVTSKGVVKGKKAGKAKITAKVGNKKYTCTVTVKNRISASTKSVTFSKKGIKKSVKVTYVGTKNIYWNVDDSSIVQPSWSKKWSGNTTTLYLTAKKTGTTYVRLTNDHNNEVYKIKVTVKAPWSNVKVVIPDTIGEQDDPENRMKITGYQFFEGYGDNYQMKISFKCVQYGVKGRSNWGEYFYCYDKNGNLLDECFLYAGSLGLGRTYNDTAYIPANTAKIVFEEYPVYVEEEPEEDYEEDEDYGDEGDSDNDPTLWSYSDVEKFEGYIDYATNYTGKVSGYLNKGSMYYSLAKQSFSYARNYYQYAYDFLQTKAPVTLTNGSTLADELKVTIELLDTVPSMTTSTELYGVNADVAADNVLYRKVIMQMYESFL